MHIGRISKSAAVPAIAALLLSAAPDGAAAYTMKTLYSFCAGGTCPDGQLPISRPYLDPSGNIYGVTWGGGAHNHGTVFELARSGAKWKYKILYSFCPHSDCPDGSGPSSSLIADTQGNFYGTTIYGGQHNMGVVFELMPDAARKKWKLKTLYGFCSKGDTLCTDGANGDGDLTESSLTYVGEGSGALYDGTSALYGTTHSGGPQNAGVAFSLTPGNRKWHEKVMHTFCSETDCADGQQSQSGLIADAAGNLYGTTERGGCGAAGTVFQLHPNAAKTKWTETVLHNFCAAGDGNNPVGRPLMDATGALFGTTVSGGATAGVIYKLIPNGAASQETVLYNFCSLSDCADGTNSQTELALDESGNIFGTTFVGGGNDIDTLNEGGGTVFKFAGTQQVLHAFCAKPGCADGEYPSGGLAMDGSGNLYGVTQYGGGNFAFGGTVFELTP